MIQSVRYLVAAVLVAAVAFTYTVLWLRASPFFALAIASVLGVLVLAVSRPGSRDRDIAADEAWLAAAPDLPPHSERTAMERDQAALPAPRAARPAARRSGSRSGSGTRDTGG